MTQYYGIVGAINCQISKRLEKVRLYFCTRAMYHNVLFRSFLFYLCMCVAFIGSLSLFFTFNNLYIITNNKQSQITSIHMASITSVDWTGSALVARVNCPGAKLAISVDVAGSGNKRFSKKVLLKIQRKISFPNDRSKIIHLPGNKSFLGLLIIPHENLFVCLQSIWSVCFVWNPREANPTPIGIGRQRITASGIIESCIEYWELVKAIWVADVLTICLC